MPVGDVPPYQTDVKVTVHDGWATTKVIPHQEELFMAAKRYLSGQHTTLWGRSFNVIDEPDVAAEWLADQVRAVLRQAWWPHWEQNL